MIEHVRIKNWKGLAGADISLKEGLTFIIGENGSGKTTLLEAICVAITGEALTANAQEMVRSESGNNEAEVSVTLRVPGGSRLSIVRRFRKDRKLGGELLVDGQRSGISGWDETSEYVLARLSVDREFFKRLVYMSEGEVFSYLHDPPRAALRQRIEAIFGIDLLRSLQPRLARISRQYVVSRDDAAAELRRLEGQRQEAGSSLAEVQSALLELQSEEGLQTQHLRDEEANLAALRLRLEAVRRLQGILAEVSSLLPAGLPAVQLALPDRLGDVIRAREQEVVELEREASASHTGHGVAINRLESLESIRRILVGVSDGPATHTVACPVCQRPIDAELSRRLRTSIQEEIATAQREVAQAREAVAENDRRVTAARDELRRLTEIGVRLAQSFQAVSEIDRQTLGDVEDRIDTLNVEITSKVRRLAELKEELDKVRQEVLIRTAEMGRRQASEGVEQRRALLQRRVITGYHGELLCVMLTEVVEKLIREQQSQRLAGVYATVADLWRRFRPERNWQVELDSDGLLRVNSGDQELQFGHLSGGEKTVLLVLARVVLCRLLSKTNFILLDEPLEHLDVRNRRSLLNFLVEAHRKRIMPQVIITTFEETLVRKFYQAADVTPILLTRSA